MEPGRQEGTGRAIVQEVTSLVSFFQENDSFFTNSYTYIFYYTAAAIENHFIYMLQFLSAIIIQHFA